MTLFLGGPLDGQRHDYGRERLVVVPIPENPFRDYSETEVVPSQMKTFEYELRRLGFGRLEITVDIYAPKGWSEMLLDYAVSKYLENGA